MFIHSPLWTSSLKSCRLWRTLRYPASSPSSSSKPIIHIRHPRPRSPRPLALRCRCRPAPRSMYIVASNFSLLRSAQDPAQCEITHDLEGSSKYINPPTLPYSSCTPHHPMYMLYTTYTKCNHTLLPARI
ncbi:hypothetical protein KC19_2G082000 [Ceratodon purpureus]|uniref:Uncharacterized protein n=1 Tax=Ceratodon purpureus TaxID=3225 RepID=A0A8T0IRG1_CERPU|nr:hypothetical protein KC19_2G081700 [Ceratodon purpureus]KAG0586317.1 hypothetical protein KC19_2G082000 [Ceratodon purpureus]